MSYLVKLVRDSPPASPGVRYEPIEDRKQAIIMLRRKLIEEAAEYVLEPSIGELADVLEIVCALAHHEFAATMLTVVYHAKIKRRDRGGFMRLLGMHVDA